MKIIKYISLTILFITLYSFEYSYSQNSINKTLSETDQSILFKSIKGNYREGIVKMGDANGTAYINIGMFSSTPNGFNFKIFLLGRIDQNDGLMSKSRIETSDNNNFLIRMEWNNNNKNNGTTKGEIQIKYNFFSQSISTYFVADGKLTFIISFESKINDENNKILSEIIYKYFKITPDSGNKKLIGKIIQFENLDIAENDFSEKLNWNDAKKVCSKLGDNWRLPTKEELYEIYLKRYIIDGLGDNGIYWSSSEKDDAAWSYNFKDNYEFWNPKYSRLRVRAVKENEEIKKRKIIKDSLDHIDDGHN